MKNIPHFISRYKSYGFTLIELLTVIAIVGILVAIIIPVVGRVRDSAKASICVSNLRQLALACQLYSSENHGRLVPIFEGTSPSSGKTWRALIVPYISASVRGDSVFSCPSDPYGGSWERDRGLRPASYGINTLKASLTFNAESYHDFMTEGKGRETSSITAPSRTIFLSDLGLVSNQGSSPSTWTVDSQSANSASLGYARFPFGGSFTSGDSWNVFPRHGNNQKANVVFHDGSVDALDVQKDIIAHSEGDPLCLFDNQ